MHYTITHRELVGKRQRVISGEAPVTEIPSPGDVLVVNHSFTTLAYKKYGPGDKLHLVRRTAETPHGRSSSLGNWLVRDKHFTSVWTNIEWMIAEGTLSFLVKHKVTGDVPYEMT